MPALSQRVAVVSGLPVQLALQAVFRELLEVFLLRVSSFLDSVAVELLLLQSLQSLLFAFRVHQLFPPQLLFQLNLLFQRVQLSSLLVVVRLVQGPEYRPQLFLLFPQSALVELFVLLIYLFLFQKLLLVQVRFLILYFFFLVHKNFLSPVF